MKWQKLIYLTVFLMLLPLAHAKSDYIFEDHGAAGSTEFGAQQVPTGEYEVISKTGNESLYDVIFKKVNVIVVGNVTNNTVEHTKICAIADFNSYNYTVSTEKRGLINFILKNIFNVNTNKTENITYIVPSSLPVVVNGISKSNTSKVLNKEKGNFGASFESGDTQEFCYIADPSKDFTILLGQNTITTQQDTDLTTDLFLQNATDEPVFTHLNVLNKNMTLLMNFDKTNGTTKAYDLTKYDHDGDFVGDAFINPSGFTGGSLQLDGSGDYVNLGDNLDNVGVNFTMAAWIKTSGGPTEDMIIAKKDDSDAGYYMFITLSGEANARFDDSILAMDATSTTFINDDLWHHVVAVRGGEDLRLYVDGSEEDSQAGMGLGSIENSQDFLIGKSSHSFDYSFTGQIDNAFIWNRSLSAIEVEKLYNSTLPLFSERGQQTYKSFNVTTTNENRVNITTTDYNRINGTEIKVSVGEWNVTDGYIDTDLDLIASWHLDNESSLGEDNTKILDSSGNGNNGTVVGAVVNINGKYDGAFDFDGTNDYINTTKLPGLDLNESSYSIWLKWTHTDAWEAVLSSVDASDTSIELQVNRRGDSLANSAGDLVFLVQDEDDNKWLGGTVGESFNDGEWHQIVWNVVSGTANDIDLYVDGVSVSTSTNEATNPDNFVPLLENVLLGARNLDGSVSRYFNGTIDEVKVYNRSLTADEIKEDYIKGKLNYTFGGDQSLNNVDANDNLSVNKFRINNASSQFVARYTMTSNIDNSYTPWIADQPVNYTFFFLDDDFPPRIEFVDPTPADLSTVTTDYVTINVSINELNLQSITYDWDGTNFTYYNDSLVFMMNFDNRSELGEDNNVFKDLSSYGNDGAASGFDGDEIVGGRYGKGVSFDGVNDEIDAGGAGSLDLFSDYTISAWFNTSIDRPSNEYLVTRYDDGNVPGFALRMISTDLISFFHVSSVPLGPSTYNQLDSSVALNDGIWHQAVVTFEVGVGSKLYIDGILDDSSADTTAGIGSFTRNLHIGDQDEGVGSFRGFDGVLDDVMIWNISLNPEQIHQLYMTSLTKFNSTQWNLYVNQSNSSQSGLVDATYTYQAHAVDSFNLRNDTEIRTVIVDTSPAADSCTYTSGNWIITDKCQTTVNVNVCPNDINISGIGYLNITNNAIVNSSRLFEEDATGQAPYRTFREQGSKIISTC